jgi:hypothetical protein
VPARSMSLAVHVGEDTRRPGPLGVTIGEISQLPTIMRVRQSSAAEGVGLV